MKLKRVCPPSHGKQIHEGANGSEGILAWAPDVTVRLCILVLKSCRQRLILIASPVQSGVKNIYMQIQMTLPPLTYSERAPLKAWQQQKIQHRGPANQPLKKHCSVGRISIINGRLWLIDLSFLLLMLLVYCKIDGNEFRPESNPEH